MMLGLKRIPNTALPNFRTIAFIVTKILECDRQTEERTDGESLTHK